MKKYSSSQRIEKGQVIPIVVIMLVAMIAMIAILLDGGALMVNRRAAQASADAGALAGASAMCDDMLEPDVIATAEYYADLNRASFSQASVTSGLVTVNTQVENVSYFAKLLNVDTLVGGATATAGCFFPGSGHSVLPVSWSCRAPVGESDSPDCQLHTLDWESEMLPLVTGSVNPVNIHNVGNVETPMDFQKDYLPSYIYIIVDAAKVNDDIATTCMPLGDLNCDINSDGINEVFGGGDRSWLDLDGGGGGAADLKGWILNGYDAELRIHTWLAGQAGVADSVYKAVQTYVNEHPEYPVVLVPVFDALCDANPLSKPSCITILPDHDPIPSEETVVTSGGTSTTYFHIAGFSALYITCIDDGGGNKCPGAKAFLALPGNEGLKNIKLIEGYFVNGYPFDLGNPGTGGIDAGVSIISLTN